MKSKIQTGKKQIIIIFCALILVNLLLLFTQSIQINHTKFLIGAFVYVAFFINILRGIRWVKVLSGGILIWSAFFYYTPLVLKQGFNITYINIYIIIIVYGISGLILFFSPNISEFMKAQTISFENKKYKNNNPNE